VKENRTSWSDRDLHGLDEGASEFRTIYLMVCRTGRMTMRRINPRCGMFTLVPGGSGRMPLCHGPIEPVEGCGQLPIHNYALAREHFLAAGWITARGALSAEGR